MMTKIKADLPLVSVIIPAYNAENFIGRTLQSVLSQTYTNIEVIVVDDGSRDKTTEIVELFSQQDSRVSLLRQKNSGVAAARNLAIANSKGDYIAPLDADDIWYSQKLEKQMQCFLKAADDSIGLVYAWSLFIDEEDTIIGQYHSYNYLNIHSIEGQVYPAMLYTNFIGNASVPLIRRVCFDKLGGYNCELKKQNAQGCEDWDIYLRIAEHYQFRVVQEFLIGYRQVRGSMSDGSKAMAKSYDLVIKDFRQRHPEIPKQFYDWSASSFYLYLVWKSRASGDYWNALVWLYKAIELDYSPLLIRPMYQCIIECILKIALQRVTTLIGLDHQQKLSLPKKKASQEVMTVAEIQNQIRNLQKLPWQPYGRVMWQRWLQVLQVCHTLYHPLQEQSGLE